MQRHQKEYGESAGPPIWILTSPGTLVRFDPGKSHSGWSPYNVLGAIYLLGNVDAERLRSINLNQLAFIHPRFTPLPRWLGVEPPSELEADSATINIQEVAGFITDDEFPWSKSIDDPESLITNLYEPWSRGEMNEVGAVRFIRKLLEVTSLTHDREDIEVAVSIGMRLAAPVISSPVKVLAEAFGQTPNFTRQYIHRLRSKGFLAPALKERSEP